MQSGNNKPNYNPIFEKLVVQTNVDSPERLVGMLAYAEYKLSKHEWTIENPNASQQDMASFLSYFNDRILDRHRTDAENLLYNFAGLYADDLLQDEVQKIEEKRLLQELDEAKKHITEEINKSKTGYWKPVWQGIVASSMFTFALFVLALLIRFAAPQSSVGQLIQYLSSPNEYQLKIEKVK